MRATHNHLDLSHYEEMARKNHRGLVPMSFVEPTLPFGVGDVAGFKPAAAKKLHDEGTAVPHSSVYDAGSIVTKAPAPVVDETEEERRKSAVDYPADWSEQHHLKRIGWAKALTGQEKMTVEEADAAIRQEVERRRLKSDTGGAVTSQSTAALQRQAVS